MIACDLQGADVPLYNSLLGLTEHGSQAWAAWWNTELLIKLTLKGVVFSFLFSCFLFFSFLLFSLL